MPAYKPEIAPNDDLPHALEDVGIDPAPGARVPLDVKLRDHEGRDVTLATYLDGSKPTVLVLAYYSCPMLCTLVLNGLNTGLKDVAWTAGNQYRVVTVSIDPRDTPDVAKGKRDSYITEYGRQVEGRGWDFLVGDEDQVRRLADAIGFRYRWDEPTQQYAHAAGAYVLTPDGRVSRQFFGLLFPAKDLRLALIEASDGIVGSAVDRLLLFCFHYSPNQGGYVLAATRLMMAGGALTLLLMGLWLRRLWRHDRLRPASL